MPDPVSGEIIPDRFTQQKTYTNNEAKFAAEFCFDKDLSTRAASYNPDGGEIWLKLEFDKVYFMSEIVLYMRFYTNWFDPNHYCMQGGLSR